ncbi:MAG: GspE/PulE family protein [Treponema sp.]|nr:GspE/PulE family protein [Treponema sp.]
MREYETKQDIKNFSLYRTIDQQYTDEFIRSSRCVKKYENNNEVFVFVSQEFKEKIPLLEKIHSPKTVRTIFVKDSDFVEFIGNHVEKNSENVIGDRGRESGEISLQTISSDAPVVNIINAVFLEAIRKKASDIHIHCDKNEINIRFRIDGLLQTVKTLNKSLYTSFVSRIKVMANLNIMENRLCQDGRISVNYENKTVDFRVSIVPTSKGQSIVLRLFDTEEEVLELEDLGFSERNLSILLKSLGLPNGMILITGPTGSGKTTTLHAMLSKMDRSHLKIITIEDPVEKEIEGVDQIQVNEEIDLTFENILRRVLRQDPDVIMVGEIRDKETAELAVRASLTGHLILSTLHTNDSFSAITRLKNLGIKPYLIASVLKVCMAQRLIRKVCIYCKGKGCEECNGTGYKGRIAVGETFTVTDLISRQIEECESEDEIKTSAIKQGFVSLKEDALLKVQGGISTKEEIIREGIYES